MQRNLLNSLGPLFQKSLLATPQMFANPQILATPRLFQTCCSLMQKKSEKGKLSPKMAKLQRKFQENNGKPVFLKGGPIDNILYRTTWVLAVIGILGDVCFWGGYIIFN